MKIIDKVAKAARLLGRQVWCRECGHTQHVAHGLRDSWPTCCGYTMTIDQPENAAAKSGSRVMAVCNHCQQEMRHGTSCVSVLVYQSDVHVRIPHEGKERCHDCYAPPRGYHHPGCDAERCPACGVGQAISCECRQPMAG